MATFQGLGVTDQVIEKERLDYPSYFTSMALSVYDNILGPTILKVWVGKISSNGEPKNPGKFFWCDNDSIEACDSTKFYQFLA